MLFHTLPKVQTLLPVTFAYSQKTQRLSLFDNWGDERGFDEGHWHTHTRGLPWGLSEVVGTVQQEHCNRRRLLQRWLEFYVCTINKSVHTKKIWKHLMILVCIYMYVYICKYIYIYMHIYICMYIYESMYVYMYVYICKYVCIYVCIYMQVCMYIWMYIYASMYVYMYIYIYASMYVYILKYVCISMHANSSWGSTRGIVANVLGTIIVVSELSWGKVWTILFRQL